MLPVSTLRRAENFSVHARLVTIFRNSKAISGFFEPFEMPWPCELGVDQSPGTSAMPSVSALIHGAWPRMKKKAGESACSIPTLLAANAPFGSTHRPVHEILLIDPSAVPLASASRTCAAFGVLKVAFFRSGETSSTPFILKSGQ